MGYSWLTLAQTQVPEILQYDVLIIYFHTFSLIVFVQVRLFATPWTVAHQAPLSMGFLRQQY